MSDQNQLDQIKQKLLHGWGVFLAACGRLWQHTEKYADAAWVWVKKYTVRGWAFTRKYAVVAWEYIRKYSKAAWAWTIRNSKLLGQKLAVFWAWLKEKTAVLTAGAGAGLATAGERIRARRAAKVIDAEAVREPEALPAPETAEEEAPAQKPDARPASLFGRELPPWAQKTLAVLGAIGIGVGVGIKWIWKLRTVIMAVPVVWMAVKLALDNMERLPESVGLDIQSSGEFARMITRNQAVYWPLGITAFCLVLMFCSKKPLLPWVISIFSLVLPWLIWLTNYYA